MAQRYWIYRNDTQLAQFFDYETAAARAVKLLNAEAGNDDEYWYGGPAGRKR